MEKRTYTITDINEDLIHYIDRYQLRIVHRNMLSFDFYILADIVTVFFISQLFFKGIQINKYNSVFLFFVFIAIVTAFCVDNNLLSKMDLLNYYENYIHSAAVEQIYTSDGDRKGFFVNEDLMQEIRIEFFQSLPILHRKLMKLFSSND